jgi:ferredoxin
VTFHVEIDPDRCQGHGKCMIECPEVFGEDEQGYAVLMMTDVPDDYRPAVERCVLDCPEAALRITR